jgi:hypothetical protein
LKERPPIWRVAANILNKQSGQPTRGGTPAWGLGDMRQLLTVKTYQVTKLSQRHRIWTDPVVRPKQRKRDIRFGTSKVGSLYRSGSPKTVVRELARYKLDLLGV